MTRSLSSRPELLVLLLVPVVLVLLPGGLPLGVVGLGVVAAAPLALHAAGVVLVFRSGRFLDFAQLQVGAVGATLFALLVNAQPALRGAAAVCPVCVEDPGPGLLEGLYWASLAVSLLVPVGLAWLLYVAVFRRLASAPRLVATVASIFLVTALAGVQRGLVTVLTTQDQRTFGGVTAAVPLPRGGSFAVGPARFSAADVLLVVAAVVLLAGTALYLQRSATGTAIRAASQDPARAATLGVDVTRVTGRVWMLVGALSGTAAVLGAMTSPAGDGEDPAASSLVRVLVVAVVARLVSLPVAGLAALALGVLTAAVQFSVGGTNLLDGSLVVVVSVLLLLQRRASVRTDVDASSAYLAGRQARPVPQALRSLPPVVRARRSGLLVGVALLVTAPVVLSPSQLSTVSTTLLLAVVGTSLLVLTGWAGLVSLGQFGLAAVGAWAAAASGLPFLLAVPLGALAGALVAVLLGLPALRLEPLTLAISTLAFAAAVPAVLLDPDALGRALPDDLEAPLLLGLDLQDQRVFYALVLLVLLAAAGAVAGLRRSRTARVLLAARDNEPAAQSFGISVLRARLTAFALSGGLAALAGALFAYQQAGVRADSFSVEQSLLVFAFAVIGGLGSLSGPALGFGLLLVLELAVRSPAVTDLVYGLGGVVLLLLAPGGLAQLAVGARDALLRRVAERYGVKAPGLGTRARLDQGTAAPITPPRPGTRPPRTRYALDDQWALDAELRTAGRADG